MHPQAFAWVARTVRKFGPFADIVEFGSRDVNGTVRTLFPMAAYLGVDIVAGPGVDKVIDAADYETEIGHDCALCLETLEHTSAAEQIIDAAWRALRPDGVFIVTCACPPRAPHSGLDGGPVADGEWYGNVEPDDLAGWLDRFTDKTIEVHEDRGDVYGWAVR